MVPKLFAFTQLARWLAPVAPADRRPDGVRRRAVAIEPQTIEPQTIEPHAAGREPFEAWLYTPSDREPIGAYLVVPGLHFLGPSDPRLDRFLHVLASAGFVVLAPFLPDFIGLRVEETVAADAERAFEALLAQPELPPGVQPGVFSISFGSLPAIRLAGSSRYRDEVGALVVFGGYADWSETIRFSLTSEVSNASKAAAPKIRDPLNQPVVFMNLIDRLPEPPGDRDALLAAWRRYVEATWGRPEMKELENHEPVARCLAEELPAGDRHVFLVGCGVEPGALELFEATGVAGDGERDFLDPRPDAAGVVCPVFLFHGLDDDVIPHTQLEELRRAMPARTRARAYLTGLYAHTGTTRLADVVRGVPTLAREVWTMARMVNALIAAGTQRGVVG